MWGLCGHAHAEDVGCFAHRQFRERCGAFADTPTKDVGPLRTRPPLPSSSNLRLLDPILVREGSKFNHKLVIVILREPFVMSLQFNLANV